MPKSKQKTRVIPDSGKKKQLVQKIENHQQACKSKSHAREKIFNKRGEEFSVTISVCCEAKRSNRKANTPINEKLHPNKNNAKRSLKIVRRFLVAVLGRDLVLRSSTVRSGCPGSKQCAFVD